MTKIAVICDTHFGARKNSDRFAKYFDKFFEEVFFTAIDEQGIKHVLHLGDLVDRRTEVNFKVARQVRNTFLEPLRERGIETHIIAGNHDVFFKNTNDINALDDVFKKFNIPGIHYYTNLPHELEIGGTQMMLVPWLTTDNTEQAVEILENTKSQIVWGHFEFAGFEIDRGHVCETGMDASMFRKFDTVYSGHFHHPSKQHNVRYLGAPYEITWADYDGNRGFHVFDTATREISKVYNPNRMFVKLNYNDTDLTVEDLDSLPLNKCRGAYVKVIVEEKLHPYTYDLFIDKLNSYGPVDVKVVEAHQHMDQLDESELIDEAEDTSVILRNYVQSLGLRDEISKMVDEELSQLYTQAMDI